jgi:hypothetical protein
MQSEFESEGKCIYCTEIVASHEIKKHLEKHLKDLEKQSKSVKNETFCHVEVVSNEMFLHLLVKGNAKMKEIDNFLKAIWLDCCGHMSGFYHKNFKIKKTDLVEDIFSPKVKIKYDYDYGSTTTLTLIAHKQYQLEGKKNLILLSRNEPLKILCSICKKKSATCLCSTCLWEIDAYFCENCSEKHSSECSDFEDYANMPVVNSPRMGECGYEGGEIDKERDGVYLKRK